MTEKKINSAIKEKAISCGLCQQWQTEWSNEWSQQELVTKFYKGIDFFISTRFLSNKFITENFSQEFLRDNGILVDDEYSLLNPQRTILIGESRATIRVNANNATEIYLCDDSAATLAAKNRSFVIAHLYGKARLNVLKFDKAYVCAILHSPEAKVIANENITIKHESQN